jgi:hypothetical protein
MDSVDKMSESRFRKGNSQVKNDWKFGNEKVTLLQRTTVRTVLVKRNLGEERKREREQDGREWETEDNGGLPLAWVRNTMVGCCRYANVSQASEDLGRWRGCE